MKLRAALVMLFFCWGWQVRAQSPVGAGAEPSRPLHTRALETMQAERARAKQTLCAKAANTMAIDACYSRELVTTDGNYVKLVRALGAMIRAGENSAPTRLPFDDAESAWSAYRDQACEADGSFFAGGTIRPMVEARCHITITQHHLEELWALYSDIDRE